MTVHYYDPPVVLSRHIILVGPVPTAKFMSFFGGGNKGHLGIFLVCSSFRSQQNRSRLFWINRQVQIIVVAVPSAASTSSAATGENSSANQKSGQGNKHCMFHFFLPLLAIFVYAFFTALFKLYHLHLNKI